MNHIVKVLNKIRKYRNNIHMKQSYHKNWLIIIIYELIKILISKIDIKIIMLMI